MWIGFDGGAKIGQAQPIREIPGGDGEARDPGDFRQWFRINGPLTGPQLVDKLMLCRLLRKLLRSRLAEPRSLPQAAPRKRPLAKDHVRGGLLSAGKRGSRFDGRSG